MPAPSPCSLRGAVRTTSSNGSAPEGWDRSSKRSDTRLDRLVAIKQSATEFSDRFEREARAVAALNHPNICQLYDVGPDYLVMEFLDGRPLAPVEGTLAPAAEWIDDFDLVELPLSGGAPRAIVNSTRYDGSGAWSPRGGMLAYVANRGRGDEIWLRSGDALSDRRLLTPDDFAGSRPDHIRALTFSRDGQWLAFTTYRFRPSLDCGVWVMPISGGTPRRVSKDVLATRYTNRSNVWLLKGLQLPRRSWWPFAN